MTYDPSDLNGWAGCADYEPEPCEKCGQVVPIGSWPFCPHEGDVNYSFKGNFK